MVLCEKILQQAGTPTYAVKVDTRTSQLKVDYRAPGTDKFQKLRDFKVEMHLAPEGTGESPEISRENFPSEFTNYETNRRADGDD